MSDNSDLAHKILHNLSEHGAGLGGMSDLFIEAVLDDELAAMREKLEKQEAALKSALERLGHCEDWGSEVDDACEILREALK
jgi:hypothetical protein